jgi:hypothetical protein
MFSITVTGGLGAGKTQLVDRLASYGFIVGSPATTMKRSLAKALAREWGGDDDLAAELFAEMMNQRTKDKYRLILQGYGEYFSNEDGFHWINKVCEEVAQTIDKYRSSHSFQDPPGVVFDSIRRTEEIKGIKRDFPSSLIVRLDISEARQRDFLTNYLHRDESSVDGILAHSSEHWLDDFRKYDITIGADEGNKYIWESLVASLKLFPEAADFLKLRENTCE